MEEIQKKKIVPWNKGKKLGFTPKFAFKKGQRTSIKTEFKKGRKYVPLSEESRRKIAEKSRKRMLGTKLSNETRQKMSKAGLGRKLSQETKEKLREAHLKLWDKRGRNPQNRDRHVGSDYEIWRTSVFQRDNWTCQTCQIKGVYLEAHHIKSWRNYPELRFSIQNGVTLCKKPCHLLANKEQRKNEKKTSDVSKPTCSK